MNPLVRGWAASAALGAGLVHFCLASVRDDAWLAALVLLGAGELAWAVAVLARGRILLPRVVLAVAVATAAGSVLALTAGILRDPLPSLAGGVLQLAAAGLVAASLRHAPSPDRAVPAGRTVLGLLAGALVVSALATPAMAATSAGPGGTGGTHGVVQDGHEH
ncbi:hypothetical protein ASF48_03365 [Rathayibacter sp. Leaf299]|uniref:hypothetical protein n=1 Tax=Rathayibacter sp. Leaf299 TaxID=1736328 RepID=UPI0006F20DF8|nr:hypothetical protein [Rathayibacter sp. Leaf299]KQQ22260.1 hypothetical protein ASF48_03365 [Rathayibacter sp. Leaf299]